MALVETQELPNRGPSVECSIIIVISHWQKCPKNSKKTLSVAKKNMICNISGVYLLIPEFSEKYLTHFIKIPFVIMKSRTIWCSAMELFRQRTL